MSFEAEPVLLHHVTAAAAEVVSAGSTLDEEMRKVTLNAARKLVAALEKPQAVFWPYSFQVSSLLRF